MIFGIVNYETSFLQSEVDYYMIVNSAAKLQLFTRHKTKETGFKIVRIDVAVRKASYRSKIISTLSKREKRSFFFQEGFASIYISTNYSN